MDDKPHVKLEEKAEEMHKHEFSWEYDQPKPKTTLLCKQAGTIYESLQRSDKFKHISDKNRKKELVILTPNRAISSHFPCHKIVDLNIEHLIIKYIMTDQTPPNSSNNRNENHGEVVTFVIKTTGGKGIIHAVMKNVNLKKEVAEVIVYGYKGQTVKEALEQDGRFGGKVFVEACELQNTTALVNSYTEMSSDVEILDGKCFRIVRDETKQEGRDSPRGAKHDAPQEATSSETASSTIPPQGETMSKPPTPNMSKLPTPNMSYRPIALPGSEDVLSLLRSQYNDLVEIMKARQSTSSQAKQQLFLKEYGKNSQFCLEMKTMRRLLELGDSVCQVRQLGSPVGSGFLLFGHYILTNAHVVLDKSYTKVHENLAVIFCYEELTQNQLMDVKVVAHDKSSNSADHKHDWALLEVCADQNTQKAAQPLLENCGLVNDKGMICIIGHPEGMVKRADPCYTVPYDERSSKYLLLLKDQYFQQKELTDVAIHTYETCFYEGSSGSPVIDENFKVVSMHTGGFTTEDNKHVVEYAQPLSLILEQIIIHLVMKNLFYVLSDMIICGIPQEVKVGVKKLSASNPTFSADEMYKMNQKIIQGDERLMEFFSFFSDHGDQPMEIN